ncbi:MAG: hypothetical protein N2053_06355 [Chitinispirillaceae bacterium]|nr:hypothetical protein [Chitinispirillaceae bacterium]
MSDREKLRNIPSVNPFFQFKIGINRHTENFIDSLTTPEIVAAEIRWNTKPSIIEIDSLKINNLTYQNIKFKDTILITSRIDTASLFIKAYDYDSLDSSIFVISGVTPSTIKNLSDKNYFYGTVSFLPFLQTNKTFLCTLQVKDLDEWYSIPDILYFRTLNKIPELSIRLAVNKGFDKVDTLTIKKDTLLIIQGEGSINLFCAVSDLNDPENVKGFIVTKNGSKSQKVDTVAQGKNFSFILRADSIAPTDTFFMSIIGKDIDTIIPLHIKVVINHRPIIEKIISNAQTLYENDTLKAVIGDTTLLQVFVNDPDCQFFDTLKYSILTYKKSDSIFTNYNNTSLKAIFEPEDSTFAIIVSDKFSRIDTFLLYLAYPWYDTTSSFNPQYTSSKILLAKGSSLIDGSDKVDTFFIPIVNSGRNVLNLTGCNFISNSKEWLSVIVDFDGNKKILNSGNYTFTNNITLKPSSSIRIAFLLSAKQLSGDSLLREKFVLFTDDPKHRADTFTITLEHNDLPKIISIVPDFITNMPYRALLKSKNYFFPPHATISITFSEPIDSTSGVKGIKIYSINDTKQTGVLEAIPLRYSWFQNYTLLKVSPCYVKPSIYFNLLPPCGLFIPTDSLLVKISDNIHDRASTPSGPNNLDINLDNIRNSGLDTSIALKVDSITFTVISVTPTPSSVISKKPTITLNFSAPIYAASIDTSLTRNRILTVISKYNNNSPLPFERIESDSVKVSFTIGRELFYNDTLICLYKSRYIRDKLGFATDNNKDGIDATIFDTSSEDDDLVWGYKVKTISVISVEPLADSLNKKDRPEIKITFDDKITSNVFDRDTSIRNKSFLVISRNAPISFSDIWLSPDSTTIILTPRSLFFSGDSVFCKFTGFTYNHSYNRIINIPENGDSVFCTYEWSFISPKTGFYTYPNPYKPGRDPRHCRKGGPCGIWFKNLHTLCDTLTEVIISIYSLNTHPIFDSRKAGVKIRFGKETQQPPQWLWDTKNNRGELVGSGIYLYAIYKVDGSPIKKGKLIILR